MKVRIPAGVDDGQRIRVKGRGTPGLNGGPPGDLYVVVHVAPHPIFARSGKWDLTVKVPITFPEAALGAQVKVPTLDAPGHGEGPAGHADGQDRPRARPRHPARLGRPRRPARHLRRRRARTSSTTTPARRSSSSPGRCPATRASTWGCSPMDDDRARALHHLGGGRARRRPPADAAHLRAQGPHRAAAAPRAAAGATPTATSRCSSASRSSPTRASSLAGVRRILELEAELDERPRSGRRPRSARWPGPADDLEAAVRDVHRSYRRDLVPVSRAVARVPRR